jgi:hypothetical protein
MLTAVGISDRICSKFLFRVFQLVFMHTLRNISAVTWIPDSPTDCHYTSIVLRNFDIKQRGMLDLAAY